MDNIQNMGGTTSSERKYKPHDDEVNMDQVKRKNIKKKCSRQQCGPVGDFLEAAEKGDLEKVRESVLLDSDIINCKDINLVL